MDAAQWQEALKELAAEVHSQLGAWLKREEMRSGNPAEDTVGGIEHYTRVVYERAIRERERLRLALKEIDERHPSLRAESQLHRETVDTDLKTLAVELDMPVSLRDW